jgi:hypothetical protein
VSVELLFVRNFGKGISCVEEMGYQGMVLLVAAVIGIGIYAYQYYIQQNNAQQHGSQNRSHSYTYSPPPETPPKSHRCVYSFNLTYISWNYMHFFYRKRRRSGTSDSSKCVICQDSLSGAVKMLTCEHSFHMDCIKEWLKVKKSCPVCRKDVP